jgi:hypothetical protein
MRWNASMPQHTQRAELTHDRTTRAIDRILVVLVVRFGAPGRGFVGTDALDLIGEGAMPCFEERP